MPLLPKSKVRRRLIFSYFLILMTGAICYLLWSPGKSVTDGRHNLQQNGIWLSHGWLGDDLWFTRHQKLDQKPNYRSEFAIEKMLVELGEYDITDLYPHLAPTDASGHLLKVDPKQTRQFLSATQKQNMRVLPWIGGVFELHCFPANPNWRKSFIKDATNLLTTYPSLAGIHLNVEPWPSGNKDLLTLLDEFNQVLPENKILSIAAYPPPTRWQPNLQVHWEQAYFKQVAKRADQMVVMMYDTGLKTPKLYEQLMRSWTQEIITWSSPTPTLLGVPAYNDAGVDWHHPDTENLTHSLRGIHAGLLQWAGKIPEHYNGIAVYCHWEMTAKKWRVLKENFNNKVVKPE